MVNSLITQPHKRCRSEATPPFPRYRQHGPVNHFIYDADFVISDLPIALLQEFGKTLSYQDMIALALVSKAFCLFVLKGRSSLTELNCRNFAQSYFNTRVFRPLINLNSLRISSYNPPQFGPRTIPCLNLACLEGLFNLQRLNLCDNIFEETSLEPLRNLSKLTSLNVANARKLSTAFHTISNLTLLREINLASVSLEEACIVRLGACTNLVSLDISRLRVRLESGKFATYVSSFAFLSSLVNLTTLNIAGVLDSRPIVFPDLSRHTNLTRLDLQDNKINPRGLHALKLPSSLRNIKVRTGDLTPDAIKILEQTTQISIHILQTDF